MLPRTFSDSSGRTWRSISWHRTAVDAGNTVRFFRRSTPAHIPFLVFRDPGRRVAQWIVAAPETPINQEG